MRTVRQDADSPGMIWETLPVAHRHRISRMLARVIAELLRVPAEQDGDDPGRCDEPG